MGERAANDVSLHPITRDNWREAIEVVVADDDLKFVADHQPVALVIMSKCYVRPSGAEWTAWLIRAGDKPAGVFALVFAAEHCLLINFAIDHRLKRRGIGTRAVELALELVAAERPRATSVTLTVHPDNVAAQGLYRAAGFTPTGDMSDGEPMWRRSLRPTSPDQ